MKYMIYEDADLGGGNIVYGIFDDNRIAEDQFYQSIDDAAVKGLSDADFPLELWMLEDNTKEKQDLIEKMGSLTGKVDCEEVVETFDKMDELGMVSLLNFYDCGDEPLGYVPEINGGDNHDA